jgi:NitT/TauT family transport system ATP-binding protein
MLDEPFAALDAFTREELWCVIRDLHASRKITVCLVTHDLREAVFLADRVFVMSARPGRIVVERKIDIPRPRDLDIAFTQDFQDIVHELRSHIVRTRQ